MLLLRRARMPCVPNAGDAHNRFVAPVNPERASERSRSLPFVETTYRHDTPLPRDEIAIQPARKDSFAARIDRRELRAERGFRRRHKLPAHPIDLEVTESDSDDWRMLRGAKVVDRRQVESFLGTLVQIAEVELFVRIGLINASTHLLAQRLYRNRVISPERPLSCRSMNRSGRPQRARPRTTTTGSSPILPCIPRHPCFVRDSPKYLSRGY